MAQPLIQETKKLTDDELLVIVRRLAQGGFQMNPISKWAQALEEIAGRYEELRGRMDGLEK